MTIEFPDTTQDTTGQPIPTWGNFATTYAAIEPLNGREFIAAQGQQSEITHRVRIRYLSGVNSSHRINHNGRLFNILSVINVDERGVELVLMCSEGIGNG